MNMKLLCTRMPSFQKYQIRACLNELEREGKVYFSKESGYALCSRPVSYTHLDVYKRQRWWWPVQG